MSVRDVLEKHKRGEIDTAEAERMMRLDYLKRIGQHTLFDPCRADRKGIPEIVFGESKEPSVVAQIVKESIGERDLLLVSRAGQDHYEAVRAAVGNGSVRYEPLARMVVVDRRADVRRSGQIGILAAGTSDVAVAEEARVVAEAMGCTVHTAYDVGIAAFHRFLDPMLQMLEGGADAIIVVAGMEGALASVASSLSDVPVIGVPTSVGYGVGEGGMAALNAMLQSCSPGLVVVNIDNGVGAGATAALISLRCRRSK